MRFRIDGGDQVPERSSRPRSPALGCKVYYGCVALWSGRLAAMLFSLFATSSLTFLE